VFGLESENNQFDTINKVSMCKWLMSLNILLKIEEV